MKCTLCVGGTQPVRFFSFRWVMISIRCDAVRVPVSGFARASSIGSSVGPSVGGSYDRTRVTRVVRAHEPSAVENRETRPRGRPDRSGPIGSVGLDAKVLSGLAETNERTNERTTQFIATRRDAIPVRPSSVVRRPSSVVRSVPNESNHHPSIQPVSGPDPTHRGGNGFSRRRDSTSGVILTNHDSSKVSPLDALRRSSSDMVFDFPYPRGVFFLNK